MVIFYIGAGIGLVLAVVYVTVGALSFLRIRRELLSGTDLQLNEDPQDGGEASSAVALVPGFGWKATWPW